MQSKISNYLVILLSAALMQWHSIQFWMTHAGASGIGWSLLLEIVVIWFWWNEKRVLALITSFLLCIGPIYEITSPAIASIELQKKIAVLNINDAEDIKQLEKSLDTYNLNSENRAGWLPKINEIQEQIDTTKTRIRNRNNQKSKFNEWISKVIAIMQCLSLFMIMTAQALAISKQRNGVSVSDSAAFPVISKSKTRAIEKRNNRNSNVSNTQNPVEFIAKPTSIETQELLSKIKKIPKALKAKLEDSQISASYWCKQNNISPKNLSLAKNHTERLANGQETAPVNKLKQICLLLEIEINSTE